MSDDGGLVATAPNWLAEEGNKPGSVWPLMLARVSPKASEALDAFIATETCRHIEMLAALAGTDADLRQRLADALFNVIGGVTKTGDRGKLLSARRALFNQRTLSIEQKEVIGRNVNATIAGAFAEYDALQLRKRELHAAIDEAFSNEVVAIRQRFCRALEDRTFQIGLALSSDTLFRNIAKYMHASSKRLSSREEQIERGLLRYYTRMVAKATPFGSFCSIIPVAVQRTADVEENAGLRVIGNVHDVRTVVRLNKRIYGLFWSHLRKRSAIRRASQVRLNPTLEHLPSAYRFLAIVNRNEAFQRVSRHPAIDAIIASFGDRREAPFIDVVEGTNIGMATHDDREEVATFVEGMIDIGLLQTCSVVADQDAEWDVPLAAFLQSVPDPQALAVAGLLVRLRSSLRAYETAAPSARTLIRRQMREWIREACSEVDMEPRTSDLPLYEDATSEAVLTVTLAENGTTALRLSEQLIHLALRVAPRRDEQATMTAFFSKHYEAKPKVPLLTFYEDYFREVQKPRMAAVSADAGAHTANPFELESVQQAARAREAFAALVSAKWAEVGGAEELNMSLSEITDALKGAPPVKDGPHSATQFCQLTVDGAGELRVVTPRWNCFGGFGRYFSRFLHILPTEVTDGVIARNPRRDDVIFADLGGDASFNANFHPPLVPDVLEYPTSDARTSRIQIPISDLSVSKSPFDLERLILTDANGRRVIPVELGLLSSPRRPALYQLLAAFSDGWESALPIPWSLTPQEPPRPSGKQPLPADRSDDGGHPPASSSESAAADTTPGKIERRPRIVVDGGVVMARQLWTVPSHCIPKPTSMETDSQFFVRLNAWRIENEIPIEVYFAIRPLGSRNAGGAAADDASEREPAVEGATEEDTPAQAKEPDSEKRPILGDAYSRDWLKPQYLHFGSPLLTKLLEHPGGLLKEYTVLFEERYPALAHLPTQGQAHFTSEFVVQYALRDPAAETIGSETGAPQKVAQ